VSEPKSDRYRSIKSTRAVFFIAGGLALCIIVGVIYVRHHQKTVTYPGGTTQPISLSPSQSALFSSGNDQSGTNSTAAPTPSPTPKVLLDISGSGNQQTQPFSTSGDWTIAYTFDCSAFGSQGNFQYEVDNTEGSENSDLGANDLAVNGGTTNYYYDAGQHYLTINSECSWHVTVKSL